MFAALLREIRIRSALREVRALDDAILHDIGLDRSGIESAVREGRR
nr:DUF1127 domain-containing protein [Microvirga roseola]